MDSDIVPAANASSSGDAAIQTSKKHNAALDGIRFIAFLGVFLYHTPYSSMLWFGAQGVTVFFVLSGFLIGRILLKLKSNESQTLREKLREFYIRRSLRIFPLYYFVLALIFLGSLSKFSPSYIRYHLIWHALYLGNVLDYHLRAWPEHAGHLWSLCVEEHFYLLAPLAILCLRMKTLTRTFIGVWIAVTALRWWNDFYLHDAFLLVLSPIQFDSLTIGVAAGIIDYEGAFGRIRAEHLMTMGKWAAGSVAAIIIMTFLHLRQVDTIRTLLWIWSINLASAALVLGLWQRRLPLLSSIFGFRPLSYLGAISYGLYVYHNFILSGVFHWGQRHNLPVPIQVGLALLLTILVSMLSWHIFERPINNLKDRFTRH